MEHAKQQSEQDQQPANGFDWELQQALNHLQNAIGMTDPRRAHLLLSTQQVIKGVRES